MNRLSVTNLCKTYVDSDQRIEVLRNVDLEVMPSELVCITGQSGCGKSTLLHILGLLDSPDAGKVFLNGMEVTSLMPEAPSIRNLKIGFVFQFHYLVDDLTARENVALPMLIAGSSTGRAMQKAAELLTWFDMRHRANHYPNQLSGGEQQRIALARALINQPEVILADEPTGNLDPEHSLEVYDIIGRLNRDFGQTFVVVTHDPQLAGFADSVYALQNGVLMLE
ncbi:MAG: ABC transporter ATP-binding protein [Candidatus Cloacimonetes bacterium]|nr:ABC transporter ATP-binding protein [Candidatus Cloacimonadota bacterium]